MTDLLPASPTHTDPLRRHRYLTAGSYAFSVLLSIVALVPWTSEGRTFGPLDASWHQVMQHNWLAGAQSGTDVVFTMGPWGFAFRGFHPQTYVTTLLVWILIAVPFGLAGQWTALRLTGTRSVVRIGASVVWTAALIFICDVRFPLAIVLGPILLIGTCLLDMIDSNRSARACRNAIVVLLVISLGLSSLIKFTFFAGATVAVIVTAFDDVLRRRRFPWPAALFAASLVVFWKLAGQSTSSIWPYVRSALEITAGYAGAMSLDPPGAWMDVLGFVLPAFLVLTLVTLTGWRVARIKGLFLPLGLAGVTLILFKSAYVRHAQMQYTTALVGVVPITWMFVPWVWQTWNDSKSRIFVRVVCLVVLIGSLASVQALYGRHLDSRSFHSDLWACLKTLPTRTSQMLSPTRTKETLTKEFDGQQAALRAAFPLPTLKGSVDVYSYRQDVLLAHHLPYAPRPVFQSYAAYSPWLAKLNADHLLTDRAAETILFDVAPVDERYPSLDDGLSWVNLLNLYDVQTTTKEFIVLHRAAAPKGWHLEPITALRGHLDTPLELPQSDDPVFASIDLKPTITCNALTLLYKPPVVTMKVDIGESSPDPYRLVVDQARGGFLLSPLVPDRAAWVALEAHPDAIVPRPLRVKSLTLNAGANGTTYYQNRFEVRLWKLIKTAPDGAAKTN